MVADAFEGLARQNGNVDVVTANLLLHHFHADELARLLALAAGAAPLVAACEPRRGMLPLLASRLSWAIGANRVTRHDAPASVHAGFAGSELSALWPRADASCEYQWAGTFDTTSDGLPLIGPVAGHKGIYAAYGYGGNGITFSFLAARLLGDLIAGSASPLLHDFALDRDVVAMPA